jgi:RecB family exonuclease
VGDEGGEDALRWGGRKTRDYPGGEDARWWRVQGPVMLKRYLAIRRMDEDAGSEPVEAGIEMQVLAALPGGQMVKGYIDALLLVTADGERVVRDYKTGRPGGGDPLQLASYAWALDKGPGIACDVGHFCYLRRGDQAQFDLRPLVPLIERQYADLARGVAEGFFPLRPSAMCKGCSVRESCPYGRTLEDPLEPGGEE